MRVAIEEVQMNVPVRQAAARAHIPKSTLHYRAARIANRRLTRPVDQQR
jgi:hypothetical protein